MPSSPLPRSRVALAVIDPVRVLDLRMRESVVALTALPQDLQRAELDDARQSLLRTLNERVQFPCQLQVSNAHLSVKPPHSQSSSSNIASMDVRNSESRGSSSATLPVVARMRRTAWERASAASSCSMMRVIPEFRAQCGLSSLGASPF